MTHQAQRPLATLLALAITLALWAPTLSNSAAASTASADDRAAAPHVVVASASPIVLM